MAQQPNYSSRMPQGGPLPRGNNPAALSQQLTSMLAQSGETQNLKQFWQMSQDYFNNPRDYSNEDFEMLKKMGARSGIEMPVSATDKATAMEHIGAGIVGVLDGFLWDLIPDDYYSSRRTELSRSIGMWTGILVPSVLAIMGSMGLAAPAVVARLGTAGLKGAKQAAFKLGGKEGLRAIKTAESGASQFVNFAKNWSLPGLALRGTKRAATGAGQIMSRFGPTAGVGEKILESKIGQATFKKGAEKAMDKAARLAKKGDSKGVQEALGELGEEYAPHMKGAVEGILKSGKVGGEAGEILKRAVDKFGTSVYAADDLVNLGKSFLGYKKGGAATQKAAEKFMGSLREGLKNNKSIDEIVKVLPKARQKELLKAWGNPESKAEILKLLAENTPEAASSIMTGVGNLAMPAAIGAWEASALGSSEEVGYEGWGDLGGMDY